MTNYNPMSKEFQDEAKKHGMSGYQYMQWLRENSIAVTKERANTAPISIISQDDVSPKRSSTNTTTKDNKENKFDATDIEKDIVILDVMDGIEFENFCARMFKKLKYSRIDVTQATRDGGRDLLMYDDNDLCVGECKHWPDGTVGRPVIQKLHSAASKNSIFKTSLGVIHEEKKENETIMIDGTNGNLLQEDIANSFNSSHLLLFNMADYIDSNLKIDVLHIDENVAKQKSKEYIRTKHTKNVRYRGSTSRTYIKLCAPKDKDILITDIKQIYIPRQEVHIKAKMPKKDYNMTIIEKNSEYLTCHTEMFNCAICGGYIRKDAIICYSCESVVHYNTFFDSHSFKCKVCGKPICRRCTYSLGFLNKVCKDCATKNGKKDPISMNMNQRNIISFVGTISGIFLIFVGIGIGFILIIASILLLLSKKIEEGPYYEKIKI